MFIINSFFISQNIYPGYLLEDFTASASNESPVNGAPVESTRLVYTKKTSPLNYNKPCYTNLHS